jgi:hypothetical protein
VRQLGCGGRWLGAVVIDELLCAILVL